MTAEKAAAMLEAQAAAGDGPGDRQQLPCGHSYGGWALSSAREVQSPQAHAITDFIGPAANDQDLTSAVGNVTIIGCVSAVFVWES